MMKWLVGGLVYACIFLYIATAVFGLLMALLFHILIITALVLLGLFCWKVWRPDPDDRVADDPDAN